MAMFKLYNIKEEDSLKLLATISNLGRYRRAIVSIMDTIKLFVKGTLSPIAHTVHTVIKNIYQGDL